MSLAVLSLLLYGCSQPPAASPAAVSLEVDPTVAGPRPGSWVHPQVETTQSRLLETEGGAMLWRAIEAHGGLATWLSRGTMGFDFDYAPLDAPEQRRYTRSEVDLWSRKARQVELGEGADATLGWNGEVAWIRPTADAFPSDPRFWATTPFYFAGIPWVLADEGAAVEKLESVVLPQTGVDGPLPTLRVTYGSGVGDAPDDFYVLHLHPETHRVLAVRYIVSFPASTACSISV